VAGQVTALKQSAIDQNPLLGAELQFMAGAGDAIDGAVVLNVWIWHGLPCVRLPHTAAGVRPHRLGRDYRQSGPFAPSHAVYTHVPVRNLPHVGVGMSTIADALAA